MTVEGWQLTVLFVNFFTAAINKKVRRLTLHFSIYRQLCNFLSCHLKLRTNHCIQGRVVPVGKTCIGNAQLKSPAAVGRRPEL